MATRAARTPETVDEDGTPVSAADMIPVGEAPMTQLESDEDSLLERIRSAVRGVPSDRNRLKIYRVGGGTLEQCDELRPEEFDSMDFHAMRNRWGSGEFEVRLFGDRGIMTRGRIKLAAPIPGAIVPMQSQSNDIAALVRVISEQNAQVIAALNNRPVADPVADMSKMFALMSGMREAMGLNNQQQAPASNPLELVREAMSTARELKTAAAEMATDKPEPDEDSLTGIIRSVAPIIQAAVSQPQAQQPGANFPPLQPLQLPSSIENGAHITQPQGTQEMGTPQQNPAQLLMLGIIEDLCDMAKAGKTPTEGAEFALDSLPDDALPVLRNRYGVKALMLQFPVAAPHEEWFNKLRAEAVRLMDEPEPDEAGT